MQEYILAAPEAEGAGNPLLNIAVFAIFIIVTLFVVTRAGKTTSESADFYTGGSSFSGTQNGLAIAGDYLSAASFLGIVGSIALSGYDGFLYSIGFFVAWLVALLLVAEPLRNVGRFTMADVLSFRLRQKPVRVAAAFGTLFVSLFYLIAQMAGAGSLVSVLLNLHSYSAQAICVGIVGVIMIVYVLVGGMKGTTYVQMIKAVLLVAGVAVMTVLVFVKIRGGMNTLFDDAISAHAASDYLASKGYEAEEIMKPGLKYGATLTQQIDFISLGVTLVLGTAGLPHVLMRFYTVPTAKEARKSVTWAIVLIGVFYLFTLVLGYAAAALVGPDRILAAPGGANSAAPLLAFELGGSFFMALISAVAFATVLAVVSGLAITASASIAHDVYASVIRDGEATEDEQVRVSRITVVILGIVSIVLGILAMSQNVAFLVSLAFAIAASANLPTILFSLYWKRFNTTGAVVSIYTGLISALVLIFLSPAVSGAETAMFPNADWAIFPLSSPGIVSIPLGFLAGIVGTFMGKPDNFEEKQAEMEVRSLTGVGVEAPVDH
ncbi:cation acetate symporter [Corynebacterium gottingense]|uniref:Cation acetate symporter n=1 Tax=Corynebacterium gottingense TaxID=2041036 RepID=A0ABX9UK18_9CORY|nr:cation acetate symporter [Corynebacterium gottingense]RMD18554.1 cation acetate symporter [Corynebacterium gottingense]WJZ12629.1 Cation/acetate symporter ActP [Corynebacterium gottingense]WJZ14954.1 Cation/acetate symporter ActP [Corynebacterium gottingense]